MRDRIAEDMKAAMKAGDKPRLSILRMVQAAIQDRDIANRGLGKPPADADDILQVLTRMVKQRQESARAFDEGGRPELANQERAEIVVLEGFLPAQMDEDAMRRTIAATVAELGATGPRDMGRVMGALKERYAGQMDLARASAAVKDLLR
jgi:uncharacterized protein YqeY